MKSLKGTKTAENLMKSFAGECQARTRYTYYASIAKKQGYVQISNIFTETAEQEKEHAKKFYKYFQIFIIFMPDPFGQIYYCYFFFFCFITKWTICASSLKRTYQ